MRRYYNEFNEDYERGYKDGRNDVLLEDIDVLHEIANEEEIQYLSKELEKIIKQVNNLYKLRDNFRSLDSWYESIPKYLGMAERTNIGSNYSWKLLIDDMKKAESKESNKKQFWFNLSFTLKAIRRCLDKLESFGINLDKKR